MLRLILVFLVLGISCAEAQVGSSSPTKNHNHFKGTIGLENTDFKVGGDYRFRYFNDVNATGNEADQRNSSDTESRLRLKFLLEKADTAKAQVTLIHNAALGRERGLVNVDPLVNPNAYETVNDQNSAVINEAFGVVAFSDDTSLQAGRFNLEFSDGEFISKDDYKAFPITFEGLLFHAGFEFAKADIAIIKEKELTPKAGLDSDPGQHHILLNVDLDNLPEVFNRVSFFVSELSRDEDAAPSVNIQTYGLNLGGAVSGFSYRGIVGIQSGTAAKTSGLDIRQEAVMWDALVSQALPEAMGLKIWLNYHSDTGDNSSTDNKETGYNSLYYNSHKYGGRMGIFGWGNLTYWGAGLDLSPSEDMTIGMGLHGFRKTSAKGTIKDLALDAAAESVAGPNFDRFQGLRAGLAGDSDLGMELDVYARLRNKTGLILDARLGAFSPGEAFKKATVKREGTVLQGMLSGRIFF